MTTTTIGDFFKYASPTTLASLLVDLADAGEDNSELYRAAWAELEANVGIEEANRLIGLAASFCS